MEETQVKEKKKFNLASYAPVVGFLCLETLVFCGFYLGHSFLLYAILAIVLTILLFLVTFRQIKKDGISTFVFFLFPLLVFGALTALSSFNTNSIGGIGLVNSIFVPFGLTLFALAGFLSSYSKTVKIRHVLLVVYISLGVFVLINLLITMFYYVPFYTIIYKNSYIVYDGKPSVLPIGSMAYMLFGFQAKEVTIEYWTLFPALLFTSVIQLFFIKVKENKREFFIYLALVVLASIALIFTLSMKTLFQDIILIIGTGIIILASKVKKSRHVLDGMVIAFGALFGLFILILFLYSQTSWGFLDGLRNFINSKAILSRLFKTNRYSDKVVVIFQDLFSSFKLFGCPVGGYAYQYPNGVRQILSDIWLFDNLMSSGLFGAIFFMIALVLVIRRLFIYIKNGNDEDRHKYQIAGFVLGYLALSLVLYDYTPLVNSDRMVPFFISAPLLICLYLLGYTYNKSLIKVEEAQEEKKEEKEDEVIKI